MLKVELSRLDDAGLYDLIADIVDDLNTPELRWQESACLEVVTTILDAAAEKEYKLSPISFQEACDVASTAHSWSTATKALPAVRTALLASPLFQRVPAHVDNLAHDGVPQSKQHDTDGGRHDVQLQLLPVQLVLMWLQAGIHKVWDSITQDGFCCQSAARYLAHGMTGLALADAPGAGTGQILTSCRYPAPFSVIAAFVRDEWQRAGHKGQPFSTDQDLLDLLQSHDQGAEDCCFELDLESDELPAPASAYYIGLRTDMIATGSGFQTDLSDVLVAVDIGSDDDEVDAVDSQQRVQLVGLLPQQQQEPLSPQQAVKSQAEQQVALSLSNERVGPIVMETAGVVASGLSSEGAVRRLQTGSDSANDVAANEGQGADSTGDTSTAPPEAQPADMPADVPSSSSSAAAAAVVVGSSGVDGAVNSQVLQEYIQDPSDSEAAVDPARCQVLAAAALALWGGSSDLLNSLKLVVTLACICCTKGDVRQYGLYCVPLRDVEGIRAALLGSLRPSLPRLLYDRLRKVPLMEFVLDLIDIQGGGHAHDGFFEVVKCSSTYAPIQQTSSEAAFAQQAYAMPLQAAHNVNDMVVDSLDTTSTAAAGSSHETAPHVPPLPSTAMLDAAQHTSCTASQHTSQNASQSTTSDQAAEVMMVRVANSTASDCPNNQGGDALGAVASTHGNAGHATGSHHVSGAAPGAAAGHVSVSRALRLSVTKLAMAAISEPQRDMYNFRPVSWPPIVPTILTKAQLPGPVGRLISELQTVLSWTGVNSYMVGVKEDLKRFKQAHQGSLAPGCVHDTSYGHDDDVDQGHGVDWTGNAHAAPPPRRDSNNISSDPGLSHQVCDDTSSSSTGTLVTTNSSRGIDSVFVEEEGSYGDLQTMASVASLSSLSTTATSMSIDAASTGAEDTWSSAAVAGSTGRTASGKKQKAFSGEIVGAQGVATKQNSDALSAVATAAKSLNSQSQQGQQPGRGKDRTSGGIIPVAAGRGGKGNVHLQEPHTSLPNVNGLVNSGRNAGQRANNTQQQQSQAGRTALVGANKGQLNNNGGQNRSTMHKQQPQVPTSAQMPSASRSNSSSSNSNKLQRQVAPQPEFKQHLLSRTKGPRKSGYGVVSQPEPEPATAQNTQGNSNSTGSKSGGRQNAGAFSNTVEQANTLQGAGAVGNAATVPGATRWWHQKNPQDLLTPNQSQQRHTQPLTFQQQQQQQQQQRHHNQHFAQPRVHGGQGSSSHHRVPTPAGPGNAVVSHVDLSSSVHGATSPSSSSKVSPGWSYAMKAPGGGQLWADDEVGDDEVQELIDKLL